MVVICFEGYEHNNSFIIHMCSFMSHYMMYIMHFICVQIFFCNLPINVKQSSCN
jgi:hypothetical protein